MSVATPRAIRTLDAASNPAITGRGPHVRGRTFEVWEMRSCSWTGTGSSGRASRAAQHPTPRGPRGRSRARVLNLPLGARHGVGDGGWARGADAGQMLKAHDARCLVCPCCRRARGRGPCIAHSLSTITAVLRRRPIAEGGELGWRQGDHLLRSIEARAVRGSRGSRRRRATQDHEGGECDEDPRHRGIRR
jgi:hypothetical protein